MDLTVFKASLEFDDPPADLGIALQALWRQAKGDWNEAHRLAQSEPGAAGDWVHAYLHRAEGDAVNAGYWYRRAGKALPSVPLETEWEEIASALLQG